MVIIPSFLEEIPAVNGVCSIAPPQDLTTTLGFDTFDLGGSPIKPHFHWYVQCMTAKLGTKLS